MNFSKQIVSLIAAGAFIFLLGISYLLFSPPANFPSGSIITIAKGTPATDIAKELADMHVVKNPALLEIALRLSGTSGGIQSGAYLFKTPQNLFTIAYRLVTGSYGLPSVRITFIEGVTVREAGEQIADVLPAISASEFLKAGKQYEGYLFPDTYFFPPSADTASIVKTMRANFDTKIAPLKNDISASGHSLSDIVIMASMVEKEVRTSANRRIVAGILWDRLKLGMPLQVDAVFGYIFNRDTYSPALADLKIESPYNTYLHKGLPPSPIDNPGRDSLDAVLHPTKTNYLYYLTDKNGVMHYATTFAQHQANQQKYLH